MQKVKERQIEIGGRPLSAEWFAVGGGKGNGSEAVLQLGEAVVLLALLHHTAMATLFYHLSQEWF